MITLYIYETDLPKIRVGTFYVLNDVATTVRNPLFHLVRVKCVSLVNLRLLLRLQKHPTFPWPR